MSIVKHIGIILHQGIIAQQGILYANGLLPPDDGFADYYQWVFKPNGNIVQDGDGWYFENYGTGLIPVRTKINNTQVGTFDGNAVARIRNFNALSGVTKARIKVCAKLNNNDGYLAVNYIGAFDRFGIFAQSDNKIIIQNNVGGSTFATSNNSFPTDRFIEIDYVYDGSLIGNENIAKLYIDGVQEPMTHSSGNFGSALTIGESDFGTGGNPINSTERYAGEIALVELYGESDELLISQHFQEGNLTTIYDSSGNGYDATLNGAILDDFWTNYSDEVLPALFIYGFEIFGELGDDQNKDKWVYVIFANDQPQTPIIPGYIKVGEVNPKAGFSNTINTIRQPVGDGGLFTLTKQYPALDIFYGATSNDALDVTFEQIAAIDTTGIPEEDFRITIENLVITDMASQPFKQMINLDGNMINLDGNMHNIKTF